MEPNITLMTSAMDDLLRVRKWLFFLIVVLFSAGFSYYVNLRFATQQILVNTYGEQLTLKRIDKMLETGKRLQFIIYLFVPFIVLIRVCYNTVFVAAGNFISEWGLRLSDIYNACLKAELMFIVMSFCRLVFVEYFQEVNNLTDLNVIPFSLTQLLSGITLPRWLAQPLSYINIFEAAYVLLLAGLLSQFNHRKYRLNLLFAFASYGAGLLLWCILISYLILMTS